MRLTSLWSVCQSTHTHHCRVYAAQPKYAHTGNSEPLTVYECTQRAKLCYFLALIFGSKFCNATNHTIHRRILHTSSSESQLDPAGSQWQINDYPCTDQQLAIAKYILHCNPFALETKGQMQIQVGNAIAISVMGNTHFVIALHCWWSGLLWTTLGGLLLPVVLLVLVPPILTTWC